MDFVQDQRPSANRRFGSTQIFFLICTLGWIPFLASSFNYQAATWFPWLIGGRVAAAAIAIAIGAITFFVPRLATHSELAYSLFCVALQSSFGALEGAGQAEFTNLNSVFIFMTAIFTRLGFQSWLKVAYVPTLLLSLLPLGFKDSQMVGSVTTLVDTFTPIVASLLVGLLIGRSTCLKNELLVRNRRLQADLTSERDHQEEIIEQQLRELEKARVASAIAQATQMLAHDVRKPFSMLRMTLERLANAKSADQIQKLANIALPDIRNALDQADSLVRDVLEVSTKSRLDRKNLAPTDLVMRTVRDLKKHHPNVSVSTHIKSSHPVWGDETRIQRVLENILTNAVEATGEAGDIEISVLDQNGSSGDVIFFSIWNSGPAIDTVDADRLFDPFFTKGKTGGKGLGLAIAQKFVLEHDGKIWCEPCVRGGVSFSFELPASDIATPQPDSNNEAETELLAKVRRAFHGTERPLSILVVDDEQLYRSAFEAMIGETEVASHLAVSLASSATDARRIWKETSPDLVVLDIDLGTSSISGLQLLAEMRGAGDTTFVCIHSNRPVEANSELEAASHRTCVLPKPISHQQLFSLLLTVLETSKTPTDEREAPASESSRRFAFLDDSLTARALWRDAWPEGVLETFTTPEEFWRRANSDAAFLSGLAAVFTDIRFNGTSPLDGHEFAASLRAQFQGPIYLATDAIAQHPAATEGITGVISKEVPTRAMLATIGR